MDSADVSSELTKVLLTEGQIHDRLKELAVQVEADYDAKDLLLVGVLKGAVVLMADFVRHLTRHADIDWMAVSSYG